MNFIFEEGHRYKIRSWRSMKNEYGERYGEVINLRCSFVVEMRHLCEKYTPPVYDIHKSLTCGCNAAFIAKNGRWEISPDMIDMTADIL